MTDVERLFDEYIAEHKAGGRADPREFLRQLEGTDRTELQALIDAYLRQAPRQDWDPAGYRGSNAERVVDSLERSLAGQAGLWPTVLPELRTSAEVRRADLARRLAEALGVTDRTEKVAGYYHEMEQGLLPASGVSQRVLEALGRIVGVSADSLRRMGEALEPGGPGPAEKVFARTAAPSEYAAEPPPAQASPAARPEAEWDEVDELFRGG